MYTIDLNGFTAERQDNGTFLYKAKTNQVTPSKKPVYKDKPQFKVVSDIEDSMKRESRKMIEDNCIDILKYLTKLS